MSCEGKDLLALQAHSPLLLKTRGSGGNRARRKSEIESIDPQCFLAKPRNGKESKREWRSEEGGGLPAPPGAPGPAPTCWPPPPLE